MGERLFSSYAVIPRGVNTPEESLIKETVGEKRRRLS
jgi:hypothetical protein